MKPLIALCAAFTLSGCLGSTPEGKPTLSPNPETTIVVDSMSLTGGAGNGHYTAGIKFSFGTRQTKDQSWQSQPQTGSPTPTISAASATAMDT